ncbi:filamentous hemagglutinin N-terminal domain-containing protein, partial [Candidatus Omnitrophota bacterium]
MKTTKFLTTVVILATVVMLTASLTEEAYPLPKDPEVIHGNIDIQTPDANTMEINVQDPKAIINYSSFDIMEHETVNITLPSVNAEILNRDLGIDASQILGNLNCNGIFILVNEAGIYVGPNANIDVASLILSTRDITDQRFLHGEYTFQKITEDQLDKLLLNRGKINVRHGGFGVMIAGAVENQGIITAKLGKIALAGGEAVKLTMSQDGLISVAILTEQAHDVVDIYGTPITDQIKNTGTLDAEGGTVILKAESINGIFTKAVNLEGIVKAATMEEVGGSVHIGTDGRVFIGGAVKTDTIKIGNEVIPNAVTIEEEANVTAEMLIDINARDFITIESIIQAPMINLTSQGGIDTTHAAIINANTLNLAS